MPAPRAVLHDIAKQGLRLDKSYTRVDVTGRLRPIINIEPTCCEPKKLFCKLKLEEEQQETLEDVNLVEDTVVELNTSSTQEIVATDTLDVAHVEEQNDVLEEEKEIEVETKMKQPQKKEKKNKKTK